MDRVAGAPISWGVCEVPGWGYQLDPERVLPEMRRIGLVATEFGPEGFLPDAPRDKAGTLRAHGLSAVGAFLPVVLHDEEADPIPATDRMLDGLVAAEARTVVLAATTGTDGYDSKPELTTGQWHTLLANLDRISGRAAGRGIQAVLHPHVGTTVENKSEVDRVLGGCDVPLCLDTGHLMVGGVDPMELVREVPERIAHTHLKDVDAGYAGRVRAGETAYTDAVRAGMFRPLGAGDIDMTGIVRELERSGFTGWYVLEQDTILPGPPDGEGPTADVRASVEFLRTLSLEAPNQDR